MLAPLMVVLDGDATILYPTMAYELITEVSRRDAWQHARLMRHMHRWRCTQNQGGANVLPLAPTTLPHGVGC
jgi:hypothetical protein